MRLAIAAVCLCLLAAGTVQAERGVIAVPTPPAIEKFQKDYAERRAGLESRLSALHTFTERRYSTIRRGLLRPTTTVQKFGLMAQLLVRAGIDVGIVNQRKSDGRTTTRLQISPNAGLGLGFGIAGSTSKVVKTGELGQRRVRTALLEGGTSAIDAETWLWATSDGRKKRLWGLAFEIAGVDGQLNISLPIWSGKSRALRRLDKLTEQIGVADTIMREANKSMMQLDQLEQVLNRADYLLRRFRKTNDLLAD